MYESMSIALLVRLEVGGSIKLYVCMHVCSMHVRVCIYVCTVCMHELICTCLESISFIRSVRTC